MTLKTELDIQQGTSRKIFFQSYFALIPILNRKEKHRPERNIIRLIRKSDICKSNPILKALLIENVRICCVVLESSGRQSGKIICASAPYLFSLLSKANPKLEKFLRRENISSCLNILQQCNFDYLLSNIYQTTVIIHKGVQKYYPTLCVSFIKDSFLLSEKSLLYALNLVICALQTCAEFFFVHIRNLLKYLRRQNNEAASCIADYFNQLAISAVKSSIMAFDYSQRSVIFIVRFIRKIVLYLNSILSHISDDSALKSLMKKLYLYLKVLVICLRSSGAFSHIERHLSDLFHTAKPYILIYCQRIFTTIKYLIRTYLPLIKKYILHAVMEGIPVIQKIVGDNLLNILSAYNSIKIFLLQNKHIIKASCCYTCRVLYKFAVYLFSSLQTILPRAIHFSSTVLISLMVYSGLLTDYFIHFSKLFCNCTSSVLENQKEVIRNLSRSFINFFKTVYKTALKMQPYMVLILRSFFTELTKLIYVLAPTSLACLQEMNSSLFHASKEVVSKSCLAVKRILPSCYYTVKTVVPPTIQAAHEVIKSSTNTAVIVYPAVFKSITIIRPDLEKGIIVLLTDGNKACLEIISVSFAASCELKDAVKNVSSNIPIVYRAVWEVFTVTSYAAIEVSVTFLNAKARMLKDFKKAHDAVGTSVLLAEQEICAAYMDAVFEINAIISIPSKYGLLCSRDSVIKKYSANYFSKLCKKILSKICSVSQLTVNFSNTLVGYSAVHFIKMFSYIYSCIVLLYYSLNYNVSEHKMLNALYESVHNSSCAIFTSALHLTTYQIEYLCKNMYYKLLDTNMKIINVLCCDISKIWHVFKSSVQTSWNAVCVLAPEIWSMVEYISSVLWEYFVENVPGVWTAWKSFCFALWKLINDFAPHVWQYSSAVTPVIWSSTRQVVKKFWRSFIESSRFTWQRITLLSSEYWMLSNTYLPSLWVTSCTETRNGWKVTCYLIENCWTFTVGTCLSSWKFLHHSVAKSWRSSRVVTKTAYRMLTMSGLMLQKSFCMYSKSKTRVCIVLRETPGMKYLALNSCLKNDLRSMLQLSGAAKECNPSHCDNTSYSKHLYFNSSIKCIFSYVNFFPRVPKVLNYKTYKNVQTKMTEILFPN